MDALKVRAIVTRAIPYNESDMIVTLVSVEQGKLTVMAKSCLKPKAKLRYAAEPMNFGDYVLARSNNRYILTECSQIENFLPITCDIEKFYSASLILELLQKLSEESSPALFVHAISGLKDMAYGDMSAEDAVTTFLLSTLSDCGNQLDFKHCAVCRCDLTDSCSFSSADGIVCKNCENFDSLAIDKLSRAYLSRESTSIPNKLKLKANMLVSDLVYSMLGIRINNQYFMERK